MPSTGSLLAKNVALYKAGSPNVKISCQVDVEINMEAATFDLTCKDSGSWAEINVGTKSWSANLSALLALDATEGFEEFFDSWSASSPYVVVFGTGVTGDIYLTGTTYITNLSASSQGNDAGVPWNATLTGSGALTKATYA